MTEVLHHYLGIDDSDVEPFTSAVMTMAAFMIVGFLPLIPTIWGWGLNFWQMLVLVAGLLFGLGVLRSRLVASSWYRSGFEIMVGGVGASLIAYGVGLVLGSFI